MLCYLEHLEAAGRACGASRASRCAGPPPRLGRDADRRADRLGRRAVLLLRVLPAAGPTRASATSAARWPSCRGWTRRSSRSPTAPAAARREKRKTIDIVTPPQARLRHGGDGALHVRRRDRRPSCARCSTRCATPASRTCSRCAATRRRGRTEWTATEGGLQLLARADRADPRRVRLRDRRGLLPGGPHPRGRRGQRPALPARRRSTPARAS